MSTVSNIRKALAFEPPTFVLEEKKVVKPYANRSQQLANQFARPTRYFAEKIGSQKLVGGIGVLATSPLALSAVILNQLGKSCNSCEELSKQALIYQKSLESLRQGEAERKDSVLLKEEKDLQNHLQKRYNKTVQAIEAISTSKSSPSHPIESLRYYLQLQTENTFITGKGTQVAYDFNLVERLGNRCIKLNKLCIDRFPETRGSVVEKMRAVISIVAFIVTTPLILIGLALKKGGEKFNSCGDLRKRVVDIYLQSGLELKKDAEEMGHFLAQSLALHTEFEKWVADNKVYPDLFQTLKLFVFFNKNTDGNSKIKESIKDTPLSTDLTYYRSVNNVQQHVKKGSESRAHWANGAYYANQGANIQDAIKDVISFLHSSSALFKALEALPSLDNAQKEKLDQLITSAEKLTAALTSDEGYKKKIEEKLAQINKNRGCASDRALEKIRLITLEKSLQNLPTVQAVPSIVITPEQASLSFSLGEARHMFHRLEQIGNLLLRPTEQLRTPKGKRNRLQSVAASIGLVIAAPLTLCGMVVKKVGEIKNSKSRLYYQALHNAQRASSLIETEEKKLRASSLQVDLFTREVQKWGETLEIVGASLKQVLEHWHKKFTLEYLKLVKDEGPLRVPVSSFLKKMAPYMSNTNVQMENFQLPEKNKNKPFDPLHLIYRSYLLEGDLEIIKEFLKAINDLDLSLTQKEELLNFVNRMKSLADMVALNSEGVNKGSDFRDTLEKVTNGYNRAGWELIRASKAS